VRRQARQIAGQGFLLHDSLICNHLGRCRRAAQPEPEIFLSKLDLFSFVPFRLNRLAAEVSAALASEYQQRYGLDIPGWRILATLGFRDDACTAQFIAQCTRTHKSTISRAVTTLLARELIERVENEDDRREFRLRLTRKGRDLYQQLVPRLKRKEREILSCLSERERDNLAAALGKIERHLDLIQASHDQDEIPATAPRASVG
jgi:DNA-binding MarR family transcriptional regulator